MDKANDTSRAFRLEMVVSSIIDAFEAASEQHTGKTAIKCGASSISYGMLDRGSDAIAEYLSSLGIGIGHLVGIMPGRAIEPYIAMLGILKCGAAYVPFDKAWPAERCVFVAQDTELSVVFGECDALCERGIRTIAYDTLPTRPDEPWRRKFPAETVAYVMYTSGTTGTPKGVMVPHRAILRLVMEPNFMELGPQERILQNSPLAFDAATLEIWGALLNGGTLVVPEDEMLSLRALGDIIREREITTLWLTAGLFHAMADERPDDFAPLHQLLTGGDVVSPVQAAKVLDACPELTLINGYGPTENTTFSCCYPIGRPELDGGKALPIGRPVNGTTVFVLDDVLQPSSPGRPGELCFGGAGLALGYWRRPELTAEKFVSPPWDPSRILYRSGDMGRIGDDGLVTFHGRIDTQIKIRGYRIELTEIEAALESHPNIRQAAAIALARRDESDKAIIGWYVSDSEACTADLEAYLHDRLPSYAVPSRLRRIDKIPVTPNGKIDRRALTDRAAETGDANDPGSRSAETPLEDRVASIVGRVLQLEDVRRTVNFFDLGASSLQIVRIHGALEKSLGRCFPITDFFRFSTVESLALHLECTATDLPATAVPATVSRHADIDIGLVAIVGMAGRFPGAPDVDTFWQNLVQRRETISHFTPDELEIDLSAGEPGRAFVPARGVVEGAALFDARHFGIPPRDAERMDPQHRILLELAQTALENAGHDPDRFGGPIGVFVGASQSSYLLNNLLSGAGATRRFAAGYPLENFDLMFGNDKDFIATRIAYKLNLRGPAVNVQCACSTSLVAVAQACESLMRGTSDMALAGGVSITFPQKRAYAYLPGGMASSDGHCRTFDAAATGTVFGDGAGLVVLRRLADAIRDGDEIVAVIRGYSINNDGSGKAGYAAPSVKAQSEVITAAHKAAGVNARSIGYIEAHGTGTPLGDPIEFAALHDAFSAATGETGFCGIGTGKTNVGHLDVASGVTGLIKTALTLKHGVIPPLLHYVEPNPRIDFEGSAFYPVTELTPLERTQEAPRRAGVSALGVGGTNIHMVLEEAPTAAPCADTSPGHAVTRVFPVSASSPEALKEQVAGLGAWARRNPDASTDAVLATLRHGRRLYTRRTILIGDSMPALADAAETFKGSGTKAGHRSKVAFLFPGQGAQHVGMARDLIAAEPAFREALGLCAQILEPELGLNILDVIHAPDDSRDKMNSRLRDTALAQPAIFSIGYALARQWAHWGIEPDVMVGHSIGEFAAACIAGVFELPDALRLIALRGRLMSRLPEGVMLSVRASENELFPFLGSGMDLAAVNGAKSCVIAGSAAAADVLEPKLRAADFATTRLHTSHAFHSHMMDPVLGPFGEAVASLTLNAPRIPIHSTVTCEPMTAEQATDPDYWTRHMRRPVRFHDVAKTLWAEDAHVFLEVGPGCTMSTLVGQNPNRKKAQPALASLPHALSEEANSYHSMLKAFGLLWANGLDVDWTHLDGDNALDRRRRASSLPTYAFQRKLHWVEPIEDAVFDAPQPRAPDTDQADDAGAVSELSIPDRLRGMLSNLSGVELEEIDTSATFLELGFDSLLLTKATRELKVLFGVDISLRQLIDRFSSVDALACHIEEASQSAVHSAPQIAAATLLEPAPTAPDTFTIPTTEAQREIFTAILVNPEATAAYNQCAAIELTGPADREALRNAVLHAFQRHESLRSTFSSDGLEMHVHPSIEVDVSLVDIAGLDEAAREQPISDILNAEVETPFDLQTGPFVRAQIVSLDTEQNYLIVTAHHIVCDGWSLNLVMQDIGRIYSARSEQRHAELEPADSVAEYARIEAEWLLTEEVDADKRFWLDTFKGELPVLDLPIDHPRPSTATVNAARLESVVPPALVSRVRALAAARQSTFVNFMLAAFKLYIARITGQRDIVTGLPTSGQSARGMDALVGHYVNLLSVRTQIDGRAGFDDLLARVQDTLFEAYEHRNYTYGSLVRDLKAPRDLSRILLIPVIFNIDSTVSLHQPRFGALAARPVPVPKHYEYFEIFLNLNDTGDDVTAQWIFNTDLFERSTIERHMAGFQTLLEKIVENTTRPVSELLTLSGVEAAELAEAASPPATAYPDIPLHLLVAEQAARTPNGAALVVPAQGGEPRCTFSFADLESRANRLAHRLIERGVARGDIVGVAMPRGADLVISLLAILRAGAAYLPLDPSFPADRLAYVVGDSRAKLIITNGEMPAALGNGVATVFDLFKESESIAMAPASAPVVEVAPDDLAYVIYTSGSTGNPKGVEISHRAFVNFITSMTIDPGISAGDRLLAVTTISFDIAGLEIWGPLVSGATIVLARSEEAIDAERLQKLIADERITIMQATPITWRMMLDAGWQGTAGLKALCGGDALPLDLAQRLAASVGALWNMYGPTETTVWSMIARIEPDVTSISIGRPIANTEIAILDAERCLVPPGVQGELCIGGGGLARGYLGRADLTAERFIPHPTVANTRLYRTGDQARWIRTADGDYTLECLGRIDNQIKLRGYRVEPEEIEHHLCEIASVRHATVVLHSDGTGDQRLVAFIVPEDGKAPATAALSAALSKSLPGYMVPIAYYELPELPQTPNGKIDRKRLAALPTQMRPVDDNRAEPAHHGNLERALARLWSSLLNQQDIGRDDDFFALGGHSLLAVRMFSRLREDFHVDLPLATLFRAPTIRKLASAISKNVRGDCSINAGAQNAAPSSDPAQEMPSANAHAASTDAPYNPATMPGELRMEGGAKVVPTTEGQREIFGALLFDPSQSRAYNLPFSLEFEGPLDVSAMRAAVNDVIARHDALRATFRPSGLEMLIAPSGSEDTPHLDLSALGATARHERIAALRDEFVQTHFDLERGPLFRTTLVSHARDRHELLIGTHHIVCDGWSIRVLLEDLRAFYLARSRGETATLPSAQSIADMARAEERSRADPASEQHRRYWIDKFRNDIPVLDLPTDRPRQALTPIRGEQVSAAVDTELTEALRSAAKKAGSNLETFVFAAFVLYISRAANSSDVVIGVPSSGQLAFELERAVGHGVNFLPIRNTIAPGEDFAELLSRVRLHQLEALEHQKFSYGALLRSLKIKRDPSRIPLTPVGFSLFNIIDGDMIDYPGLETDFVWHPRPYEHFEIFLYAGINKGLLDVTWSYNTALFDRLTIEGHAASFERLLRELVGAKPPVASWPVAGVRGEGKDFGIGRVIQYRRDTTMAELFATQVAATPKSTALIAGDRVLNYDEIDRLARVVAARLTKGGLSQGDVVGLCLERSPELIASMLAAIRLGITYVPLEPSDPSDRLNYIIRDSGASSIVSSAALAKTLGLTEIIRVDDICDADLTAAPDLPPVRVDPLSTAYLIYTSGSTGTPKGVMGTHRATINRFEWMWREFPFRSGEVMCQKNPVSFIDSIWEIFGPLLAGFPLVIIDAETGRDPRRLLSTLHDHKVSRLLVVPSLLRATLDHGADLLGNLTSLQLIFTSGESLSRDIASRLFEAMPDIVLVNLYGSSEVAADVTCEIVDQFGDHNIPLGRPIDNCRLYILDGDRLPVPFGQVGELYVGGDCLAAGYHNRPELSAERFLPDPFAGQEGARMFATGDRARFTETGRLLFEGRADNLIKIHGQRIELGEIEARLSALDGVREAAVAVQTIRSGHRHLTGFVTIDQGCSFEPEQIRSRLLEWLPEYMVPHRICAISAMPLNFNGKLDRLRLVMLSAQNDRRIDCGALGTTAEEKILKIWKDVLATRAVGLDGDFFELGGHSLMAVDLFAGIRRAFGIDLPISTLLAHPTVRSLSARISEEQTNSTRMPAAASTEDDPWDTTTIINPGPGTSARPLFIVGGVGGNVNNLHELGQLLGRTRPVIGLQTRGVLGHRVHDRIEAMAEDHLHNIRRHQARGPYLLAGYSGGALVAFEMARQLKQTGETVSFLGLLDMPAPGFTPKVSVPIGTQIWFELGKLRRQGFGQVRRRLNLILRRRMFGNRWLSLPSRLSPDFVRYSQMAEVWQKTACHYRGGLYDGDVRLIVTPPETPRFQMIEKIDETFGWRGLVKGALHIVRLEADHLSMLKGAGADQLFRALEHELRQLAG